MSNSQFPLDVAAMDVTSVEQMAATFASGCPKLMVFSYRILRVNLLLIFSAYWVKQTICRTLFLHTR